MLPLLLLAVVATAIIIERFWSLRRKEVLPPGLGEEVREWARGRQLDPAHIDVLRRNSPLGELLAAALDVRYRPRELIKERVEDVGRHVMHQLERFMNILTTGVGDVNQLAGGIGKALICTATGLVVAIPALMFHRYFRGVIAGYVVEMEKQAIALLDTIDEGILPAAKPAARQRRSEG